MDLRLTGKAGIVTGASRGIGRAIAQSLSDEGMRLALVSRSRDQLEELSASLAPESLVHAADLRAPEAPAKALSWILMAGRPEPCNIGRLKRTEGEYEQKIRS
jgi:short-subunit dehydrogenase